MYQLVSAIAQLNVAASPWAEADLSALTLSQIDSGYSDAYLRVKSPFWTADRTMLFSVITKDYLERDHTIAQFFDANGNNSLPAANGLAKISKGQVKYADAYWAGYKLNRGKSLQSPTTIPPVDDADVLIMRKEGVDARVFYKNCLVSVNGLIHRVDADGQYVYVIDAAKSNYHSRRNEVGIINFREVGELEFQSITPDMLFRAHPDQPFANQVFIKAPTSSFGKTAALVMGGYLFILDNLTFFRTADDVFCLDIQSIPLLDRFFESRKLIDLSCLGLEYNGANDAQISREQLYSDEVITKWLTMSQSFLVYIDSPNITVERGQLAPTRIARQYLAYEEPKLPMLGGFGLIEPYWVQEDDGVFSVTVGDNIRPHHLFHKTPPGSATLPADNRIPYDRESYTRAQFLDITSEKVSIIPKVTINMDRIDGGPLVNVLKLDGFNQWFPS